MRLIDSYNRLSGSERRLFFRALVLVAAIRLALWTVRFRLTRAAVDRLRQPAESRRELDRLSIRRALWAVEAAARRVPAATCLTQGLAAQALLGRLGQPSELRLGVARNANGKFEAHAWVEIEGRVVIGGAIAGFRQFVQLQKRSS
jgi:hypothetical protein